MLELKLIRVGKGVSAGKVSYSLIHWSLNDQNGCHFVRRIHMHFQEIRYFYSYSNITDDCCHRNDCLETRFGAELATSPYPNQWWPSGAHWCVYRSIKPNDQSLVVCYNKDIIYHIDFLLFDFHESKFNMSMNLTEINRPLLCCA